MRFLVLLGSRSPRIRDPEGLPLLLAGPTVAVYGDMPVTVVAAGDPIVVGEFGRRAGGAAAGKWPASLLTRFMAQHWGSFVAFRSSEEYGTTEIATDPSGTLPCYHLVSDGTLILGSDAETVFRAAGAAIEIDWDEVALQLLRRDWRSRTCALRTLREIPAGCRAIFDGQCVRVEPLWSPQPFLDASPSMTFDNMAENLRNTIQSVVDAQFADTGKVLVGISGGLDSSIVCACLAKARVEFTCFTMFSEGGDGDERDYARLLARHFDVPLREYRYTLDDVDLGRSSVAPLPRPIGWPFQQSLDAASCAEFARSGAQVLARGSGGDGVFSYNNSAAPVFDTMIRSGPSAAIRTLFDISAASRASLWQVASAARRLIRPGNRRPLIRMDATFLAPRDWSTRGTTGRHPWVDECADALPGQQRHVDLLSSSHNFTETQLALPMKIVCPLLAQPVLEAVLGVPGAMWVKGGINRSVARHAFSDDLPGAILQRRTKGGPDAFAALVFDRNRHRIRETLLDGDLAFQGIIERHSIDQAMTGSQQYLPPEFRRLLALADAEAWIQHWKGRTRPDQQVSFGAPQQGMPHRTA